MKNKSECGEVVVEASIIVTLSMLVITIMLYVGMILYQQTLVSVMANQTATNLAQVYSNNLKDPFAGYIEPEKVYQSITYSNMKTDAYVQVLEQKANVFAQYRLKSSRILADGTTSVEVELVKKPNELLKSQLVVTIHDRYDMPLVAMFGANSIVEFAASGRADCVDILEYVNGVEAIGDPEGSNVSYLPGSKNCTITFIPDRDNPSNSSIVTVLKGHSIISSNRYTHSVMPRNPSKGDLEFAGWFNDNNSSFVASTQINENLIVYGLWKCQVKLNANGGKINQQNEYSFKVTYGSRTSLSNPQREGYTFLGWFDSNGNQYLSNDTIITENVVLTAKWERKIHTVTFDVNGGVLPANVNTTVSVVHNDTTSMPIAKRTHYIFAGWFDSNGTKYTNSTKITSSVTLRAQWQECKKHKLGDCGVTHSARYSFNNWHSTPYYGTTAVRCIVCSECGCFLDGNANKADITLKKRYGSTDAISSYIWCARHGNGRGGTCEDTHLRNTSNGSYCIH